MPTLSLKTQLAVIASLFLAFAALVMFQTYYSHSVQQSLVAKLMEGNQIIGGYLALEESENALLENIRLTAEGTRKSTEEEFKKLSGQKDDWFQKFQGWHAEMEVWQTSVGVKSDEQILTAGFAALKKRQFEAYGKAIELCRQNQAKDANYILSIERSYRPSVHRSTLALLDGVKSQIEDDSQTLRRFYAGSSLALLLALLVLTASAGGVVLNLMRSLRNLQLAAVRIGEGDFSSEVPLIKSPVELAKLAEAFNHMQSAVKTRDHKIHEDNEEIRKLNESLERKVVERNKTIMQQNIALTRKNEELEQVLYAASHDLRTPLIGIQGFSEELSLSCAELVKSLRNSGGKVDPAKIDDTIVEEIAPALKHIINGSKRMEILLEGLLRISRMGRESLQLKKIDMNDLVKNVAAGFDYQLKEIGGTIEIGNLESCFADQSQFEQVFTNLIGNAIKYRDPERKLKIEVGSAQDGDSIRYFVKDNGIGIAPEHIDRVFHAFFRVDPERAPGEGVGLAIVNRALDLHGGRTWVESEKGAGSKFHIEIPKTNFPTSAA